jgi:hypothetical protein
MTEGPTTWEPRWIRKHPPGDPHPDSIWWAPRSRGWWIAVLFAVGSSLFALGALPAYALGVGRTADSITFFAGSIFFTSAALFQYDEAVDGLGRKREPGGRRRWLLWDPHDLGWLASGVQLIGTFWFNWSTFNAIRVDLSATLADERVWRPDALGSIAFLVASGLAWYEVCHGWGAWRPHSMGWWITAVNLAGSVAFGVSAVAAYVVPATGQLADAEISNLGTFVGALCFLAGAILLMPERVAGPDTR